MDFVRAPHNAQTRLKTVMTPIFDQEMGNRLRVAREKSLRTQGELAALMTTPGNPISQQQIAAVEHGRLNRLNVTWARLDAVFGRNLSYVLIGADKALYDEKLIGRRYYEHRQKTLRKNANPEEKSRHRTPRVSRKWRCV